MKEKKKILVAVDGSEHSKRAVQEAIKYGECFDTEITLLNIIKAISSMHYSQMKPPTIEDNEELERIGQAVLQEAMDEVGNFKSELHTKIKFGNPADKILQEAEEGNYDLIVMGSRGLGVFSRSFLGSVSNNVLHHTDINVLIVR